MNPKTEKDKTITFSLREDEREREHPERQLHEGLAAPSAHGSSLRGLRPLPCRARTSRRSS